MLESAREKWGALNRDTKRIILALLVVSAIISIVVIATVSKYRFLYLFVCLCLCLVVCLFVYYFVDLFLSLFACLFISLLDSGSSVGGEKPEPQQNWEDIRLPRSVIPVEYDVNLKISITGKWFTGQ